VGAPWWMSFLGFMVVLTDERVLALQLTSIMGFPSSRLALDHPHRECAANLDTHRRCLTLRAGQKKYNFYFPKSQLECVTELVRRVGGDTDSK
jgi:hypothetical protein